MKRILMIVAGMAALAGCGSAYAGEMPIWQVSDRPVPAQLQRETTLRGVAGATATIARGTHVDAMPVTADETPYEAVYDDWWDIAYYEPYTEPETAYMPSDGLTAEGGVNYYGGRMETYYSSNVLPHYQIGEWTADEEGFWRTEDGQYVVAASDMEIGTVFEGSKGECIVLDTGCAEGVTDYYTSW